MGRDALIKVVILYSDLSYERREFETEREVWDYVNNQDDPVVDWYIERD